MMIAPAARNFSTKAESFSGSQSLRIFEPPVVRTPAVSNMSLIVTGTPWSGPRYWPRPMASSAFLASALAGSRSTVMKALSFDSTCSNRSRAAPTASVDETSRAAMRRDRSGRLSSRTSARFMSVLLSRRLRLLGHPRRAPTELLQLCHDAVEICDLRGNGFEVGGRKIEPFKQGEPAGDFVGNLHRVLLGKIATVIVRRQRQDSPHRPTITVAIFPRS